MPRQYRDRRAGVRRKKPQRKAAVPACSVCGVHVVWWLGLTAVLLTLLSSWRSSTLQAAAALRGSEHVDAEGLPLGVPTALPTAQHPAPGTAPRAGKVPQSVTPPGKSAVDKPHGLPQASPVAEVESPKPPAAPAVAPSSAAVVEAGNILTAYDRALLKSIPDIALESIPATMAQGVPTAALQDWAQSLSGSFGATAVPLAPPAPITVPEPASLDLKDGWLSLVRVQKTASKTVHSLLMWLAADAKAGDPRTNRNVCACSYFSTSDVPMSKEVKGALEAARGDPAAALAITSPPYSAEVQGKYLSDTPWPVTLGEGWFRGSPLPGRDARKCAFFDPPPKAVQHAHCPYLHAQHLQIGDIMGQVGEGRRKTVKQHHLVTVIRHPLKRVLSEFKHVARNGPGLWDYCHSVKNTQKLRNGWRTPALAPSVLADFLSADDHALGMRNRQLKMLSGMVTEPSRPLPAHSWKGFTPGGPNSQGMVPDESVAGVGAPDVVYRAWAAEALALATWRLSSMDAVLVAERLAESLAVLMVRYNWVPLLSDVTPGTARGPTPQAADVPRLQELRSMQERKDPSFKRQERHILTIGLEQRGKHFDHSVHVDFSSCPDRLQRVSDAGAVWGAGTQGTGAGARSLEEGVLPEVAAGLSPWNMLVCIGSAMADDMRVMDASDSAALPIELTDDVKARVLSLNEGDAALHAHAIKLLQARVAQAKEEVEGNPVWMATHVRWANDPGQEAQPIPAQ